MHQNDNPIKEMKLFGQGIVNAKPDTAQVVVGVVTEDVDIKTALEKNSNAINNIIDALNKLGIDSNDIQTENYYINIQNDYIDGKQVFRGYSVTNYLRITVEPAEKVGEVIDTSVNNGANFIGDINFLISNISLYYNKALKQALEDAQNKAMTLAIQLKSRVNIVPVKIDELNNTQVPTPIFKSAMSVAPVEVGENKVVANIEATFLFL